MTTSIAIDSVNYDIYADSNGNLAIVSGDPAIAQNSSTAIRAQRGEMQYDMTAGMPMFATAFNQLLPRQFEAAGRAILKGVDGVKSVQSFQVTQNGNTLSYAATLLTVNDNEVTING